MPNVSAIRRSRLSLVHRSVGESTNTEAIKCASVRPIARLYNRRASIIRRSSLCRATRTCGKRSSSASVFVRSRSDPEASSAMMNGWMTICPWSRCLRNSLLPERRRLIQINVSARINLCAPHLCSLHLSPPCGAESSSVAASGLPGTPVCERSPAR